MKDIENSLRSGDAVVLFKPLRNGSGGTIRKIRQIKAKQDLLGMFPNILEVRIEAEESGDELTEEKKHLVSGKLKNGKWYNIGHARLLKCLFIGLLLCTMACKKTSPANEYDSEQQVIKLPTENYVVSTELIKELSWKITGRWDYNHSARRVWKMQGQTTEGIPTNDFIVIEDVPDTLYWKPGYQRGDILDGIDVSMLVKQ
jgi:hypothetical protein